MVGNYVKIFVFMFGISSICAGHLDGVFVVYPFKEGDVNQPKTKFSARKFDSEVQRKPKTLHDSKVHLVYPTNENVIIMTPGSIEIHGSEESYLDTTIVTESSSESLGDFITTTKENIDSYNEDFYLGGSTEMNEGGITTASDIDSTKIDIVTTEIPIQTQQTPTEQEMNLISKIYEETGPKKTLRKRMFDASKLSRKYPSGLKMNNDMKKIPTTMRPSDSFKNWYKKTTRHKVMKEKLDTSTTKSVLKIQTNNRTTEKHSSKNVYRRRYYLRT